MTRVVASPTETVHRGKGAVTFPRAEPRAGYHRGSDAMQWCEKKPPTVMEPGALARQGTRETRRAGHGLCVGRSRGHLSKCQLRTERALRRFALGQCPG